MGEDNVGSKIGMMIDGEFHEISRPSIEIHDNINSPDEGRTIIGPMSLDVNFQPVDGLTMEDVIIVLCGIANIEQIKQNNWRKLHGFPMKRRKNV